MFNNDNNGGKKKIKEELKHKRTSEQLEENKLKLDKRRQTAEQQTLNELIARISKTNNNKK